MTWEKCNLLSKLWYFLSNPMPARVYFNPNQSIVSMFLANRRLPSKYRYVFFVPFLLLNLLRNSKVNRKLSSRTFWCWLIFRDQLKHYHLKVVLPCAHVTTWYMSEFTYRGYISILEHSSRVEKRYQCTYKISSMMPNSPSFLTEDL